MEIISVFVLTFCISYTNDMQGSRMNWRTVKTSKTRNCFCYCA